MPVDWTRRIHALFNHPAARSVVKKARIPLALAFLLFVLTQLEPAWFLPGLAISVAGEALQVWCLGTIRTRKQLTMTGPYLFARNPMYIGRFFLILGVLVMTGNPLLIAFYVLLYYFYMVNRVKREEKALAECFGDAYAAYCRDVPPYLPTLRRFEARQLLSFNRESLRQNHALQNLAAAVACWGILYFFTFIYPL